MAAPTTILTIIKKFSYRGQPEEWSNTYMLDGATPSTTSAWRVLFDAIVLEEKKLYVAGHTVVAGYGYDTVPAAGVHAIWSVDLTAAPNTPVPGTLVADSVAMAGDQAAWVRWGLDRFNSNGKRVYLRKYYHGGQVGTGGGDYLSANYVAALTAWGDKCRDGTLATSRHLVSKTGELSIGTAHSTFVTTRTLKRRGKRPPT